MVTDCQAKRSERLVPAAALEIVAGADYVAVAGSVVEPTEEHAEKPGGHPGISLPGTGHTRKGLVYFVDHGHTGRHGINNP